MKLHILSDLHCEFEPWDAPAVDADVVILAGDIDQGARGIRWAQREFADRPVIYVAGNHELYGGHWTRTIDAMRETAAGSNVHFLENDAVILDGVRFIGSALWTDFALFGVHRSELAMERARAEMTDFRLIEGGQSASPGARLAPGEVVSRFDLSKAFIEAQLAEPFNGPTVVVTHHLPHRQSVAARYARDLLSAAFASDLSGMIETFQPVLWVHGHTHDSMDYRVGGTRIVCNPRGYPLRDFAENREFDPELVVNL